MTETALTLIAVAGSLIGVVLGSMFTYTFTKNAQVSKALHESRISAYAEFAAAVMDFRRALMERWFSEQGTPPSSANQPGVYVTRSAAWAAYFRVQLLAGSDPVRAYARSALDQTSSIKDSADRTTLVARGDESRAAVEAFVSGSRDDIAAHSRVL